MITGQGIKKSRSWAGKCIQAVCERIGWDVFRASDDPSIRRGRGIATIMYSNWNRLSNRWGALFSESTNGREFDGRHCDRRAGQGIIAMTQIASEAMGLYNMVSVNYQTTTRQRLGHSGLRRSTVFHGNAIINDATFSKTECYAVPDRSWVKIPAT